MRVAGIPLGVGQQQQQQQQQIDGQTMLLMLFEGANGSTIFTDSSSKNNTINRFGSPSITTSYSKFGNSCLGINATSYLKINRSENFDIGAGQPFTIQMWLYITGGTGAYGGLISMRDAPVYCPIEVNITNNGTLATKIGNATLNGWDSSSFNMSTYVWRHFAIVGDGSLIKVYNHGVMQNVAIAQPAWPNDEYLFQINRNGDNQMQSCAYIDYLSFHKAAFWLSDFTPPTAPFSSSGGMITVLHLQFNGANGSTTFTDSSPYNKTIVIHSGTPTNSSDNAEVGFGNRGKFFDGSSIRVLSTSNDFSLAFNDNFTIEARFEVNSLGGYQGIICDAATGSLSNFFVILDEDNSNKLTLLFKTTTTTYVVIHDTLPTINTKNHVAVVRNNGFLDLYFNGVRAATRAVVGNEPYQPFYSDHLTVGALGDALLSPLNGYIDELRIRKEAVYTGNFTPPTAPFTG